MSASELVFDPTKEFQVLEEFDFNEDIQRPESIRFFTYEEQATDFVEKLLPASGRIPKALVRKAEYEVDSFTKLYKRAVKETEEGFIQQEYTRPLTLSWVHYGHTGEPQTTEYNWSQRWSPLYSDSTGLSANYYLRLIDALPKSAIYFEGGDGIPVYINGKSDIEGRIVLDKFPYTRTQYREDGTYSVVKVFREDTNDTARFTHYVVDNPPIAPPSPLVDHPFLSVHPDPVKIESTEPLPELLPTLEAIFEHAVPETNDPYNEGLKYIKIYDINLRDVPYDLWKKKFLPVPVVEESPPPKELMFPKKDEDAPSKSLLDAYKTPWYSSVSSRKWLNEQSDGGMLVALMLLSQAGDVGVAAIPPPVILPETGPIEGTAEDCLPPEISSFTDFLTRGVYRAPKCASCGAVGHSGITCPIKKVKEKFKAGYGCIPIQFVQKEREDDPYHKKLPWTPGTHDTILKEHMSLLEMYRNYHTPKFIKNLAATPAAMSNETHLIIVSILRDEMKADEDKLFEIQTLLKDAKVEKHIYLDPETNAFLICEHELEILKGSLAKDPQEYFKTWCEKESGFYVCRYSGERITSVIQHQDQFDEQSRVQINYGKIEGRGPKPSEHVSFALELKNLQMMFDSSKPADDLMYLLISLIQVVPSEEQLEPILGYMRSESDKIMSKIQGKKLNAKQQGDIDMALGIYGFNSTVILLQTHSPQLIPRRSFGSKPLILRGFPRDTTDINDAPLVDSLLGALLKTFESYPGTFKGSSVTFLRTLLKDRKAVRKVIMTSLEKQFKNNYAIQLEIARQNLEFVGVGEVLKQTFAPEMVIPKRDVSFLKPTESISTEPEVRYSCKVSTPWISPSTRFSYTQETLEIVQPIKPSLKARLVIPLVQKDIETKITAEDIKRRLKIKPINLFKGIASEDRQGVLQSYLMRLYVLLAEETISSRTLRTYIDTSRKLVETAEGDPSLRRDIYKGFILELGSKVSESAAVLTQLESVLKKDAFIKSLLSNAVETRMSVDNLVTREREEFKIRLRNMTDAQRDITNTLRGLGLAPYLINREDREGFIRELQADLENLEPDNPLVAPEDDRDPADIPEEGLNDERDIGPQGEILQNGDIEAGYDYGDYGDRRARAADGEEYVEAIAYNYDEDI